jgi:hypothetical protein
MKKLLNAKILLIIGIILAAAISRIIPHYPNVTPVIAMALFGGAYLSNRWFAYITPLLAMFLSDCFLGFHESIWAVYLSIVITTSIGFILSNKINPVRIFLATLISTLIFFIITNFSVWMFSGLYDKTFSGLIICYTLALPFLRNSVFGDLIYTGVLFGGFSLITKYVKAFRYERI